ncbi:AAA family ATPase [Sinorhizobium numidicum]|uniref:AAA family ATPase n=1 Tax=Sinorhizobium numidicum TaxID=680248 RepID=A0ABY8CYT3_9HYPH|nr:hypothetical protein [Sinorhizobium numidicum]WEX77150.1 AAA family ATPase [Sinorhizobium numidicum]WEX83809.1 AAA family ATPase [Sinorhizobium numidicum]
MPLIILIGASGSGKTTIARAIEDRFAESVDVFFFGRIGVPSAEQMVAECGSGEGWRRAKTIEWMAKLAQVAEAGRKWCLKARPGSLSSQTGQPQPVRSPMN